LGQSTPQPRFAVEIVNTINCEKKIHVTPYLLLQ
jgi:hypothetical protein